MKEHIPPETYYRKQRLQKHITIGLQSFDTAPIFNRSFLCDKNTHEWWFLA